MINLTISLVVLTKRIVAVMAIKQQSNSCHRVQLLATKSNGSMVVPMFWGEHPKGIPFLFIYKQEKSLVTGITKGRQVYQTLLEALKFVVQFSHKNGSGLFLLKYTKVWSDARYLKCIMTISIQLKKILQMVLSLDMGKLRTP